MISRSMQEDCIEQESRHVVEPGAPDPDRTELCFYTDFLDLAPDALLVRDLNGRITFWNLSAEKQYGWSKEEALGRNADELLKTRYSRPRSEIKRTLRDKGAWIGELTQTRRDGTELLVEGYWSLQTNEQGAPIAVLEINRDVTDSKWVEGALQESEARLGAVFRQAAVGVALCDLKGRFHLINDRFCQIVGRTREELLRLRMQDITHPDDRPESLRLFHQLVNDGREFMAEKRYLCPDGRVVWVCNSVSLISNAAGRPKYVLGLPEDITSRKQAEAERERLLHSERLARQEAEAARREAMSIVESIRDAFVTLDRNWRYVYVNEQAAKLLCMTREEMIGKSHWDLFPGAENSPNYQDVLRAMAEQRSIQIEEFWPPLERWLSVHLYPSPQGMSVLFQDTTAQKQAEEALRAAREAAEAANRTKGEFLASVSHEIRTPLNAVIGMLSLLDHTDLSSRQQELVTIARTSAEALQQLLNDILDFSRIEAGKIDLERVPFQPRTVLEEAAAIVAAPAVEKGLDLQVHHAPNVPAHVLGDPGRLRQVLVNLASNAVKFTHHGHVLLTAELAERQDGESLLRFTVEDTGVGIPPDRIDRIFERFTQADASTTRRYGGTGLGLAICKLLVEAMGGSIGVHSVPGEGSTFWFTLPVAVISEEEEAVDLAELAEARILIVDDSEPGRRVLSEQLSEWGLRTDACGSAAEALQALSQARAAGDPYHIAILDHHMPDMDGPTLGRTIKSDPELRKTTLILLSSIGPEVEAELEEAGFCAWLNRPVQISRLTAALLLAWRGYQGAPPVRPESRLPAGREGAEVSASFPGMRILVVDDNPANQRVAQLMLRHLGCQVDLAANGREAVDLTQLVPYDLVLMDCAMPVMDGFAATAEIRRREGDSRHTPIVALTAKAFIGDRQRALTSGMDDYLAKPVQLEDLQRVLSRWQSAAASGQASTTRGTQPEPEGEAPSPTGVSLPEIAPVTDAALDPAVISRLRWLAHGEPGLLAEIVESFLSDAEMRLTALRQEVPKAEASEIEKMAHALKGASRSIGAQRLAHLCQELEDRAETGRLEGAADLLQRIEQEFPRVREALARELGSTEDPRPAEASDAASGAERKG